VRVLDLGDTGLLIELASLPDVLRLHAVLDRDRSAGRCPDVEELVPAERTLLVRYPPRTGVRDAVLAWIRAAAAAAASPPGFPRPGSLPPDSLPPGSDTVLELPVRYDGDDLDDVGRLTGLGADGVVAAHTGRDWTVAFTGFAPGFGYLVGGDPRLQVPRLAAPRVRVPAGAVGLAGAYTGVYPRPSPGGWRLIGIALEPVWDSEGDPPALLRPGVRVRFVAVS
jgi:KipI family sensor histidine kinase inhibitor